MAEPNPDLQPVHLDPATTSFVADGHTFFVQHNLRLPVIRDRWLEKYQLFATFGRDAKTIMNEHVRIYGLLNEFKVADAIVAVDNIMRGAADLLSRESPILYVCTLFINREDEDVKGYDPEFAKEKIECWKRAGIAKDFFLSSALSFLRITDGQLKILMQISSSLPNLDVLNQSPDLTDLSPSDAK